MTSPQLTKEQFVALNPCKEALDWALAQPSLYEAWETCKQSHWMWWLMQQLKVDKEISIKYAQGVAEHVKHLKNAAAAAAAAAYAAYAYAAYAYVSNEERAWQAGFLRALIPNPFAE